VYLENLNGLLAIFVDVWDSHCTPTHILGKVAGRNVVARHMVAFLDRMSKVAKNTNKLSCSGLRSGANGLAKVWDLLA